MPYWSKYMACQQLRVVVECLRNMYENPDNVPDEAAMKALAAIIDIAREDLEPDPEKD